MIAVLFEVMPHPQHRQAYLDHAAALRPLLEGIDGFISVERFQSLANPAKLLSLSVFRDEGALVEWRNIEAHRAAQKAGRGELFADYRLRIATVIRDYGMHERGEAPADLRTRNG
jgi:heme-degrading monooxygenase HmoA